MEKFTIKFRAEEEKRKNLNPFYNFSDKTNVGLDTRDRFPL
jgi:hypothetical protein